MPRRVGSRIAISASLVFEYEEVLVRETVPRLLTLGDVDQLIRFVCDIGEKYDPGVSLRPALRDADDDFLLELAVAARVEYVVTHNVRDFAGAAAHGVKAITPGQFLRVLKGNT